MKTFYFNIQSKGGTGKSMLTYLQALLHEKNDKVGFVDIDSSTQTSTKQLRFLAAQSTSRLFTVNIFDKLKKIERERLFEIFESLNNGYDFGEIFFDFGAPESEQIPPLLEYDFTIDEFKEFEKSLNAKFVFNVVVCGGTAYASSFDYLKKIASIVKGKFDVIIYLNEQTFLNYNNLVSDIQEFAKKSKTFIRRVKPFGNIQIDRQSGQLITDNVKNGLGMDGYKTFTAKTIIKREVAKLAEVKEEI